MSLVISRREKERILVAGPCEVEVRKIEGNRVRIAVKADKQISILRAELLDTRDGKEGDGDEKLL